MAGPGHQRAHHDPCPGMLERYTLLLYGTSEDMTARPTGPQGTRSACVQQDTEGLCQGECPVQRGPLAGRQQWWAVGVCSPGQMGADQGCNLGLTPLHACPLHRMPQPCLPPGPPLSVPVPATVLRPHAAGGDCGAWAPSRACPAGVLPLPRVLLHLPQQLPAQLHFLSPAGHTGRASGLLLRTRCPQRPAPADCDHLSPLAPGPGPGRGAGPAGYGLWKPLLMQSPLCRLPPPCASTPSPGGRPQHHPRPSC